MERAATLYGAGDALRTAVGAPLSPAEQAQHERSLEAARTALGGEAFARAWDRGSDMDLEVAIAFATETYEAVAHSEGFETRVAEPGVPSIASEVG